MSLLNIDLPDDLNQYVQDYQHRMKMERGVGQFSKQSAIYAIIREHKNLTQSSQLKEKPDAIENLKKETD